MLDFMMLKRWKFTINTPSNAAFKGLKLHYGIRKDNLKMNNVSNFDMDARNFSWLYFTSLKILGTNK